jgi:hypothetical protein
LTSARTSRRRSTGSSRTGPRARPERAGRGCAAASRRRLAAQRLKLPVLGDDDDTANRAFIREFVVRLNRALGQRHGLAYAEPYFYIGPEPDIVEEYVRRHAVKR